MLFNHKDFLLVPKDIMERVRVLSSDRIGFVAKITTKTGKITKALRFDFPFKIEALSAYIDENPDQLKFGDLPTSTHEERT